jgi:hypothetical protein
MRQQLLITIVLPLSHSALYLGKRKRAPGRLCAGVPSRVAQSPRRRFKRGTLVRREVQRVGQHAHRVALRRAVQAAFEVADRAHAQPGPLGQVFLREPCGLAVPPQ